MTVTKKAVYNLEFPPHCNQLSISGYDFIRVDAYGTMLQELQHCRPYYDGEFEVKPSTGKHAITATLEINTHQNAVLEWGDSQASHLMDVLLLLGLFTRRDVFTQNFDNLENLVITHDSRYFKYGGTLIASIKPALVGDDMITASDMGIQNTLNEICSLIKQPSWQQKYNGGYFLFLARQMLRTEAGEEAFISCWTIWEHLFAVHNRQWLSPKTIASLNSSDKISYILAEYKLLPIIDAASRSRIETLASIRNRIIHYGRFPEGDNVAHDATLFLLLTELVILKALNMEPTDVFNTMEKLEDFLKTKKP
jgi:hypothetical protein